MIYSVTCIFLHTHITKNRTNSSLTVNKEIEILIKLFFHSTTFYDYSISEQKFLCLSFYVFPSDIFKNAKKLTRKVVLFIAEEFCYRNIRRHGTQSKNNSDIFFTVSYIYKASVWLIFSALYTYVCFQLIDVKYFYS